MATAECWLCFVRGQLHPSGVGEPWSPHWDQSCSGVTFPMPWECREGRAEPMDLDNQISCSQTARLEPITHSRDVTWECGSVPASSTPQSCCSFLTSFGNFSTKASVGAGNFSNRSCWSPGASMEGRKAKKPRVAGFRADPSLLRPCGSLCLYHNPRTASRCLPALIHIGRSHQGSSQPWDANAQGFSAEVPAPNQGLFSC